MSFTSTVISQMAVLKIDGWPEGHPHLTKIDGYPFGYGTPLNPNPLLDKNRDGYASSFKQLYRSYKNRAARGGREFSINMKDFYYLTSLASRAFYALPRHRIE